MWFSPTGEPLGFYHQTAPAELKDVFITNLDERFFQGEEISAWSLTQPEGPLIGKMLAPGMQEKFRRGNIYRYLCEPLGHGDIIDMAAHAGEIGRAGFSAWNPLGKPFTPEHAERLRPVQPLMEEALRSNDPNTRWKTVSQGNPHLLVTIDGRSLLAIDNEAERILTSSHLLRQNFSMTGELRTAPGFVALLIGQLETRPAAELHLPVADGRLSCRATHTRLLRGIGGQQEAIHIALALQVAEDVAIIDHVMKLPLTPLQREMALFGIKGGERSACARQFGVSDEALKKHVRAILRSTQLDRWDDLGAISA